MWHVHAARMHAAGRARTNLERHLPVLLRQPVHKRHRAAHVAVLGHAERSDVLLRLEREQVEQLAVAGPHKELRVLLQVPRGQLRLDFLPAEQHRVDLRRRPGGREALDGAGEVGGVHRDQLLTGGVEWQPRVQLIARPLEQVVDEAAVVLASQLRRRPLLDDAREVVARVLGHLVPL